MLELDGIMEQNKDLVKKKKKRTQITSFRLNTQMAMQTSVSEKKKKKAIYLELSPR